MIRIIILLFSIILTIPIFGNTKIKVAVIDTGLFNSTDIPICDIIDISDQSIKKSFNNHGDTVSHLIHNQIDKKFHNMYCQLIIKVFPLERGVASIVQALEIADVNGADIINLSISGQGVDEEEKRVIRQLLDAKIKIFVAAGNNGANLDKDCNAFPACYFPELIVIGNGKSEKERDKTSNYGKIVDQYIDGNKLRGSRFILSGTSASTAVATGRYINKRFNEVNRNIAPKSGNIPKSSRELCSVSSDVIDSYNKSGSSKKAIEYTYKSVYIQSGMNQYVNKQFNELKQIIPEPIINFCEDVCPIVDAAIKQKIVLKWHF